MKRIIIFASGSGSNAENIIRLSHGMEFQVVGIYCNNPHAGVIERADKLQIPCFIFNKSEWNDANSNLYKKIISDKADLVVLAGFLWKVNEILLGLFPKRIVNIHPSLLPKFGGKGMYGKHVHEAVIAAGETQSGITIHLVNLEYDKGEVLFQKAIDIPKKSNPDELAALIHKLEYEHFAQIIRAYLLLIS